jgi:lipopolysaccharide transport system permease protein
MTMAVAQIAQPPITFSGVSVVANSAILILFMWNGDYLFVIENLVMKDFKIRYRNMSLGVFWSLLNPLIMMGVLTFVFTIVFPNNTIRSFPVFVLCGLIPYNFFSVAWITGTNCLVDNAGLVKRVPIPRLVLPVASVLSNCVHLLIQIAVLLSFTLAFGFGMNRYWLWLPLIWLFEIVFVMGLVMLCSAIDVYVRDVRYAVESSNLVLFWLVPIFYDLRIVPQRLARIYEYNPVAALILALRTILMEGTSPRPTLMWKLAGSSLLVFCAGLTIFKGLERRFYEHL